jgi:hypothetical protein
MYKKILDSTVTSIPGMQSVFDLFVNAVLVYYYFPGMSYFCTKDSKSIRYGNAILDKQSWGS